MNEHSSNNANSDRAEKPLGPADVLRFFGKEELKTTVILLYAALALTLWKYTPSLPLPSGTPAAVGQIEISSYTQAVSRGAGLLAAEKPIPLSLFLTGELKCFAALVLMGLIPMAIVKWGFREKLADYGLRFGNRYTIQSVLIFTPVMLALGYWGTGANYALVYPFNPLASRVPASLFRLHLIIYAFTYYVGWEFMFRGFLLKGLEPKFGLFAAILVQALAATLLHIGHPLGETLGCLGGSIFWGCLALRAKSLLPGWVQHAALGLALDAAIFARLTGAF
ncbi:MAG: CPBP family intramembrane metalloprotease [Thermoguttaceae bacterium]|nr:CPBP family intramembrane metalloprotease [Thermoguttaceae bacterium]